MKWGVPDGTRDEHTCLLAQYNNQVAGRQPASSYTTTGLCRLRYAPFWMGWNGQPEAHRSWSTPPTLSCK
jgi:hypothetical protein